MLISSLQNTQGIVGYNYQKTERTSDTEIYYLHSKATHLPCPNCRPWNTSLVKTGKTRDIRGLCIGFTALMTSHKKVGLNAMPDAEKGDRSRPFALRITYYLMRLKVSIAITNSSLV